MPEPIQFQRVRWPSPATPAHPSISRKPLASGQLRGFAQHLALNLKNGFVPKAFVFAFNNIVALNLIFNIFFSAQLSPPAQIGNSDGTVKLTALILKDISVSIRGFSKVEYPLELE
jgi:hypothetical protein